MTLNVNQARGALKMPDRSYTTTCVSLVMPSASIAAANAASEGIMCCWGDNKGGAKGVKGIVRLDKGVNSVAMLPARSLIFVTSWCSFIGAFFTANNTNKGL